jgi:hypothetical protein
MKNKNKLITAIKCVSKDAGNEGIIKIHLN